MKRRWWWCWQRLMRVVMVIIVVSMLEMTISDPQINLLKIECSPFNATTDDFFRGVNVTFLDVRSQLSNEKMHFATATNSSSQSFVHTMVQCRNYLSTADCVACFDAAASKIRDCGSVADGAHAIYDGCFLRYENYRFDNQAVQVTVGCFAEKCGNHTASQATIFDATANELLTDLEVATPKINGFFAATKREVSGGGATVYAVAQCTKTIDETSCQNCLTVAYGNIKKCSQAADGRAFEVGCFLRYSETPFFSDNQTTDITPFLGEGSTRDNQTTPFLGGGSTRDQTNHRLKIPLGISAGVFGLVLVSALMIIYYIKRNDLSGNAMVFWRKKTVTDQNVDEFLRNYGPHAPKRYNYSDIKRITNSFCDKLGQGGYGVVYKGKLLDGQLVAVKVLTETEGNGEEFINEVTTISRTSHVNVVTFLGFCSERNKRALVYEFMSNGSLDKFIYNDGSPNPRCHLHCKALYQIVIGVARGLEYLHRGCSTRIVHFDIKPQNILLDDDFCPKIADFGLAKLDQRKKSIMSTVSARGTVGYIAPEVFSRNFGGVSHKSDVYSYGMMVLEVIGGRNDIEAGTVHSSEVYFQDCIYEQLKHREDIRPHVVATEEEKETIRKMSIVSFWCIQTIPADRPSMTSVVEMLEGSLQSLQIPPKPFFFTPTCSAQDSSASLSSSSRNQKTSEGIFKSS